jgi:apolipoprotein N-acyltransferase
VPLVLIQHNSDPWKSSDPTLDEVSAYRADLRVLQRLTREALGAAEEAGETPALVVWPETAFVPRIAWHYRHRTDPRRFALVEDLLSFIEEMQVPILLGNDHAEDGYSRDGFRDVVDYNGVLLFEPGKNVIPPQPQIYEKMHLVPFTEHFPYERQFPRLYEMLLNGDTHMWEPGREATVFSLGAFRFSTPVCFEDTFGSIGRRFVQGGARAFVNLSNDAWSKSLACQYQHLSMAVFRSVENRVPTARSTASGQTALVDPTGRVLAMADPFIPTWLLVHVPVLDEGGETLYTRWGDYVGRGFAALAAVALLAGLAGRLYGAVKATAKLQ